MTILIFLLSGLVMASPAIHLATTEAPKPCECSASTQTLPATAFERLWGIQPTEGAPLPPSMERDR
ncbi:MAG TPA: hypothetical protein VF678_13120 [bacterium]